MKIITTKERFLQKKDDFNSLLIQLRENNDKDGMMDCVQNCLDDVFGEEYKGQFSESEVHILNAFLKTLGLNANRFFNTDEQKDSTTKSPKVAPFNHKGNLGALSGLAVGILIAALIIEGSKPLLCGLTIGAATIAGGLFANGKPRQETKAMPSNQADVELVIKDIESVCEKVDSFMNICCTQIERVQK